MPPSAVAQESGALDGARLEVRVASAIHGRSGAVSAREELRANAKAGEFPVGQTHPLVANSEQLVLAGLPLAIEAIQKSAMDPRHCRIHARAAVMSAVVGLGITSVLVG